MGSLGMFGTADRVYVDKKSGKVIEISEDQLMTTTEMLSSWLDKDLLPEGVHDVLLNVSSDRLPEYRQGSLKEWEYRREYDNTRSVCIKNLYLFDHSGLSISTAVQGSWDTSVVGVIGVMADTDKLAEEYLNKIVKVWDDFLLYGSINAYKYENLFTLYADNGGYEGAVTVDASLIDEEQCQQAAGFFGLSEDAEWVPLSKAGSKVLTLISDLIAENDLDTLSDEEANSALATIKSVIRDLGKS